MGIPLLCSCCVVEKFKAAALDEFRDLLGGRVSTRLLRYVHVTKKSVNFLNRSEVIGFFAVKIPSPR